MKKVKEFTACALIGLGLAGVFYVGVLLSGGLMTRAQAGIIMGGGFLVVSAICMALVKGDK